MHRRTDLWGPDGKQFAFKKALLLMYTLLALVFDPDRFLDDRVRKYLTPNPFIFCPFNAGPRICLGQQVCLSKVVNYLFNPFYSSLPITKLLFSLFGYYKSLLDSGWKHLKIFNLLLIGLVVMG
jgi:hypothetical protein